MKMQLCLIKKRSPQVLESVGDGSPLNALNSSGKSAFEVNYLEAKITKFV